MPLGAYSFYCTLTVKGPGGVENSRNDLPGARCIRYANASKRLLFDE